MPDFDTYLLQAAEWFYSNPITTGLLLTALRWLSQQTKNTLDDTLYNRIAQALGKRNAK